MMWTILSAITAVITLVLVLTDNSTLAIGVALLGLVVAIYGSNREKSRREQQFRDQFHSAARIRETHDLSHIRLLRDDSEIVAVRAVRREFPGISLSDAVGLVRNL
ncbi:hypothetical protein [Crossiella sp. CA198]|uniref:hypothetical protein n=1 Tax=Crossiella sp. CA198 TaxID=3455607 RepID=UPI003F8D37EF